MEEVEEDIVEFLQVFDFYSFKGFDPGGSEDPSNGDTAHAAAIMVAGGGGAAC